MSILDNEVNEQIQHRVDYATKEIARAYFARQLWQEVSPRLPHSLEEHFTFDHIWAGFGEPPSGEVEFTLKLKEDLECDTQEVFGTIVKVAQRLLMAGWQVEEMPVVEASGFGQSQFLDVTITARREPTRLQFQFLRLPESDRCKLVPEEVNIPARTEIRYKAVCEGEPVKFIDDGQFAATQAAAVIKAAGEGAFEPR